VLCYLQQTTGFWFLEVRNTPQLGGLLAQVGDNLHRHFPRCRQRAPLRLDRMRDGGIVS
jgi:hypothetical protein